MQLCILLPSQELRLLEQFTRIGHQQPVENMQDIAQGKAAPLTQRGTIYQCGLSVQLLSATVF